MRILLIGCGNIGGALLSTWVSSNVANEIIVVQPSLRSQDAFLNTKGIIFVKSIQQVRQDFNEDMIVLAVKPQSLHDIAPDLKNHNRGAVVVSTLAGVPIKTLIHNLPNHTNIIRIMPNIAIRTGNSVNLAFMSSAVSTQGMKLFHNAFISSGDIFFLSDEEQIDVLTPIFGSGPAYFFLLANILLDEVKKVGINMEDAKKMLDLLIVGSASLINQNNSYSDLISSVTSKKGVTEAALQSINPQMRVLMEQSLKAALKRTKELQHENCD